MAFLRFLLIPLLALLMQAEPVSAQKKATGKYPSLFWEISGNGLKKPSYLFGTMHVSSKMAFHLSDSFYLAIKNVDAVALELNPDHWQREMVDMEKLRSDYTSFVTPGGGDFLAPASFRIMDFTEELKLALNSEPTAVNSLLYRTYKDKEDFEEDTFLDLYIFQTGRKLGKRATGVENYSETEKLILEAYTDMAKEKKKKRDYEGDSRYDIMEKLQEAYRQGNLDLLDSLDLLTENSMAFREKFIYKRNEIQASSIDTILRKSSLFVGVGASHLPGERGVIELLRKKGYKLRPIFMSDKDAPQRDAIDKLKVPVSFSTQLAEDSSYSVSMPGPLLKMEDERNSLDRCQYADMNNGTYYMVTRVRTHGPFLGLTEKDQLHKLDSLLYENIPGKILQKKQVLLNGHPGFDITNRTRRGDLQRSLIIATDYEMLIFKMSGKENYVSGQEAERFFSSVRINTMPAANAMYMATGGAFAVKFPQPPAVYHNQHLFWQNGRWEYEAKDPITGDAYLVLKQTINNFGFIGEDTLDLSLLEESFRNPKRFVSQEERRLGVYENYPCLDVKEKQNDSSYILARYLIRGPHYYALAVRTLNPNAVFSDFFNSFHFTGWVYPAAVNYEDTFFHFRVSSPIVPMIDNGMRKAIEDATAGAMNGYNYSPSEAYWPKARNAAFFSDTTGELVNVTVKEYSRYFFAEDSTAFWKREALQQAEPGGMTVYRNEELPPGRGMKGYYIVLRDTNSSRTIEKLILFQRNAYCKLESMGDTISARSSFLRRFYDSFTPLEWDNGRDIFSDRLSVFFDDLFSKDSARHTRAQQSIQNLYYGEKGLPKLIAAIDRLSTGDKDYYDSKAKLIAELGFIRDSSLHLVVGALRRIYERTADTSMFRNEVVQALAHHKTKESYDLLKQLLLDDPPVFEEKYSYLSFFRQLGDSLELSRRLFPDILQLLSVQDYRTPVLQLLVQMTDSGIIKAADYENYFARIYFDAKVELKKQQAKDEKIMEQENKNKEEDDVPAYTPYRSYEEANEINDYAVLLMPFFDKNNSVPRYFEKLLQSRDASVRLNTAVLMLRNKKPVPDSVMIKLAADDMYSIPLIRQLGAAGLSNLFPSPYRNQLHIARGILLAAEGASKPDSVVFLQKQKTRIGDKEGLLYIFKYRQRKEGDWAIGISGLQPLDEKEVNWITDLSVMTDKKIKEDEPLEPQLQRQLRKLLLGRYPGAINFFMENDSPDAMLRLIRKYQD